MSLNKVSQDNKVSIIDRPESIIITNKVVKFGASVYQFHNVTGFGLTQVKNSNIFPIQVILILFGIGYILVISGKAEWGILAVLASLAGVILNLNQPKRHGLELYVNSGDNTIFITTDKQGIKDIVLTLYEFMESGKENSYVVNIDQSRASIGVGYTKNLSTGQLGGSIDNR